MSNRPAKWVGRPLPHSTADSALTTRRQQRWGPARVIMDKTHLDLACRGHKSTWALGYRGRNSVVDVYITRLRKILKVDPQVTLHTLHGIGFRLDGPASKGG